MAELCQFWDQTAAGEVRAETSDWRRDQTDRSRLRAPIGGFLQRNRKEVRLRFWSTGAIEDNSRGAPRRNTDTTVRRLAATAHARPVGLVAPPFFTRATTVLLSANSRRAFGVPDSGRGTLPDCSRSGAQHGGEAQRT